MLRKTFFLTVAAILLVLATSSRAQAWYAYHYRYGGLGGYGGLSYGGLYGGYGGIHYAGYHYGGYGLGGVHYGYYRRW
jgi:hypothetical protein